MFFLFVCISICAISVFKRTSISTSKRSQFQMNTIDVLCQLKFTRKSFPTRRTGILQFNVLHFADMHGPHVFFHLSGSNFLSTLLTRYLLLMTFLMSFQHSYGLKLSSTNITRQILNLMITLYVFL